MSQRSLIAVILAAALAAAAPALARSVTVENNCEAGVTRCLRVYNGVAKTEFCLDPGQFHEVRGLDEGATYCAWCDDDPPPENCRRWPVRFD